MNIHTNADDTEIYQLTELFKILSDPTRVKLLTVLYRQEACVGELAEQLGATQSAISHQLSVLKSVKLVQKRRAGKHIYYTLSNGHVQAIIEKGQEYVCKYGE